MPIDPNLIQEISSNAPILDCSLGVKDLVGVDLLHLVNALGSNIIITNLDLGYNYFDESALEPLVKILSHPRLLDLDLGSNRIRGNFPTLAIPLKTNSSLINLNLSGNNLNPRDIEALASILSGTTSLTNLNLMGNNLSSSIENLAKALQKNKSLASLNLMGCGLTSADLCVLVKNIQNNYTLTNLNIEGNNLKHCPNKKEIEVIIERNKLCAFAYLQAADNGNIGLIKDSLNRGVSALSSNDGNTALHLASKRGHLSIVEHLLTTQSIGVVRYLQLTRNHKNETAIFLARNHPQIISFYIHFALQQNHLDIVQQLCIIQPGVLLEIDSVTTNSVRIAIQQCHSQNSFKYLKEQFNMATTIQEQVELIKKQKEMIQILQAQNRRLEELEISNPQVLEKAVECDDFKSISRLIKAGAEVYGCVLIEYANANPSEMNNRQYLREKKAIFSIEDLRNDIASTLESARTSPNTLDVTYIRRLKQGAIKLLKNWEGETLSHEPTRSVLDEQAVDILLQRYQFTGNLESEENLESGSIIDSTLRERFKKFLQENRERLYQQWKANSLPESEKQEWDNYMVKHIWEGWVDNKESDNSFAPYLATLSQDILLQWWKEKKHLSDFFMEELEDSLEQYFLKAINEAKIDGVLEKELLEIVEQIPKGKYSTMDMFYIDAIPKLLESWRKDKISKSAMMAFENLLKRALELNKDKIIGELHTQVKKAAVHCLIEKFKSLQTGGPSLLGSSLLGFTIENSTKYAMMNKKYTTEKPEEQRQALRQLLNEWKKKNFPPDLAGFLCFILTKSWHEQFDQLNLISNPLSRMGSLHQEIEKMMVKFSHDQSQEKKYLLDTPPNNSNMNNSISVEPIAFLRELRQQQASPLIGGRNDASSTVPLTAARSSSRLE